MEHFDGRQSGAENFLDLHEMTSESWPKQHEIKSEFAGGTVGKLHETTSEFAKGLHETKSESGKRAHEIKSELAEETARTLAEELRRAAEV